MCGVLRGGWAVVVCGADELPLRPSVEGLVKLQTNGH